MGLFKMTTRATITQAEMQRAIRAARKEGVTVIERVWPDGSILRIPVDEMTPAPEPINPADLVDP